MPHCCVPLCKSSTLRHKEEGVSYHGFPSDETLREEWLKNIGRQGPRLGSKWTPSKHSKVCSRHFTRNCFSLSTRKRVLLPKSVPTIFSDYPQHLQNKSTKTCRKPPKKREQTNSDSNSTTIPTADPQVLVNHNEYVDIVVTDVALSSLSKKVSPTLKLRQLQKQTSKIRKGLQKLKSENKILKKQLKQRLYKDVFQEQIEKLKQAGINGNLGALFLLEQIHAFGKKKICFQESTLKICALLERRSPKAYKFLRRLQILHIPHQSTLKRYIGYPSGETGITSLIKSRLKAEFQKLKHDNEKLGSLIIDEMSIRPKLLYDRRMDMFVGHTTTELDELGIRDQLANRMLCFLFRGLSTSYRIPVAFFFTNCLQGAELYSLTKSTIQAVEETGFIVQRVVTDNCKVNTTMFNIMSGGEVSPEITHPLDPSRKLFLAYDQSHIIKNVRNQFLKKKFLCNGQVISSHHLQRLYKYQKSASGLIKPVRFLTRKLLYPNNLEKMNVQRAVQIFSPSITSALETMLTISPEKIDNIGSLKETVTFLKMFHRWHNIHDICNTTQGYYYWNSDKEPFTLLYDERIQWLNTKFVPYLEKLQNSGNTDSFGFSSETYQALMITTKSTVMCISHLLENGFAYVLTRGLSSDDVESLFSHIRQMGGYNDAMDARACMHAFENTLKTGIVSSSLYSNVGIEQYVEMDFTALSDKGEQAHEDQLDLPEEVLKILEKIHDPPAVAITLETCSLAMLAGFLVRVAEENIQCSQCLENICTVKSPSPLLRLIYNQDRGGLRYPKTEFVSLLNVILSFISAALRHIKTNERKIRMKLVALIQPFVATKFNCSCNNELAIKLILEKFVNPLLDNKAKHVTDCNVKYRNFFTKPVGRKLLRV